MRDKVEQLLLNLMAVLSILISILDWAALLDDTFLEDKVPNLTLLLVGIITGYLALERRGKLDKMDQRMIDLSNRFSQVSVFLSAFRRKDHFSEILLIYELRQYGKLVSENSLVVESDRVLDLWRDSIAGSRRWMTITYTAQEYCWDSEWGNAIAQGIQTERISVGGVIRRVFVIDDEEECERMKPTMEAQEKIGVEVRWIIKEDLLRRKLVAEHIEALGTLDVSIVDDSWLLKIYLDRKRRYTHAEAMKDQALVDKATLVFEEAFGAGHSLQDT